MNRRILGLARRASKLCLAATLLSAALACAARGPSTPATVDGPIATSIVGTPQAPGLDARLDALEEQVSTLRGLPRKGETKRRFLSSSELAAEIGRQLDKNDAREQIEREQALYRMLGLIDPDTDLDRLYRALLGSQVLGLYDPETDEFLVLENSSGDLGALAESTYAHEFAHRLQDAQYDLEMLAKATKGNADRALALSALIEGDATLTQLGYGLKYMGRARLVELMSEERRVSPPPADIPYVMLRALEFPYQAGQRFAAALRGSDDRFDAIDRAFLDPPLTTEQVIHVEKYLRREAAMDVQLPPDGPPGEAWTRAFEDVLGEFLLRTWLRSLGAPGADRAAAGWGGDRVAVFYGPDHRTALAACIVWDDPETDGPEFFSALTKGLDGASRWRRTVDASTKGALWEDGRGAIGVRLHAGSHGVTIAAGPSARDVSELLDWVVGR